MGKKEKTQPEIPESTLIDFLYIDKRRADSLISQLRNGTLRSVTKTHGTTETVAVSVGGTVPPVVNGSYAHTQESQLNAAENYDPYHSQILDLLNDLSIPPLETLPENCTGKLVIINSTISIRDIKSIKTVTPLVIKNQKAFNIPTDKETNAFFRFIDDMVQKMNDAIDLTVSFNNQSIKGVLSESGLSINPSDLNRTYGTQMPGSWYVLGILDATFSQPEFEPTESTNLTFESGFEVAIDAYIDTVRKMYSVSTHTIIPILIYRAIDY